MRSLFVRDGESVAWGDQGEGEVGRPTPDATAAKSGDYSQSDGNQARHLAEPNAALTDMQSTNTRDHHRLEDLIYHHNSHQGTIDQNNETVALSIKNKKNFAKAIEETPKPVPKDGHNDFFQTERVRDNDAFNNTSTNGGMVQGKSTAPQRFS